MQKYIDFLKANGATMATEFSPSEIFFAEWAIMKCQYGCPMYGKNRCCPPYAPDIEKMRRIAADYRRGILFAVDAIEKGTPLAVKTAGELFRDGHYKAIAFGTGPCHQCETCTPDACPHPWTTAPSMEACGIDVMATARAQGIEVPPFSQPGAPTVCVGMLLVD